MCIDHEPNQNKTYPPQVLPFSMTVIITMVIGFYTMMCLLRNIATTKNDATTKCDFWIVGSQIG